MAQHTDWDKMEIFQPGKDNNDDVKPGRLEADAEIYNPDRKDPSASERWREMSRAEKLSYFKEYYLKYVIMGLLFTIIASYMVYVLVRPEKKDTFFGALFNIYFDSEKDISDEFGSYLGENVNSDRIFVKSYYDSVISDTEINNFYEKRRYDVFITTESRFKTYAKTDNYLNLKDTLPEDIYKKYEERIVYCNNEKLEDNKSEYPYGISVKDCNYTFYDYFGNVIEDPVVGIVINTKRKDTAIKFINFLLD